ncbi:hypothetical protein BHM03_00026591 [Ensete ventricosum]|nr:hypothetical protein BHM03_00026591 [Ensete ventricosum]
MKQNTLFFIHSILYSSTDERVLVVAVARALHTGDVDQERQTDIDHMNSSSSSLLAAKSGLVESSHEGDKTKTTALHIGLLLVFYFVAPYCVYDRRKAGGLNHGFQSYECTSIIRNIASKLLDRVISGENRENCVCCDQHRCFVWISSGHKYIDATARRRPTSPIAIMLHVIVRHSPRKKQGQDRQPSSDKEPVTNYNQEDDVNKSRTSATEEQQMCIAANEVCNAQILVSIPAANAATVPRPVDEAIDATLEVALAGGHLVPQLVRYDLGIATQGAASEAVAALIHGGVDHLVHEVHAGVTGEAVSEGVADVLCLHLGGDGRVHWLVVGGLGEWTL